MKTQKLSWLIAIAVLFSVAVPMHVSAQTQAARNDTAALTLLKDDALQTGERSLLESPLNESEARATGEANTSSPTVTLSPRSITFGTIASGESAFQRVTLSNVGTTTLRIGGVTITGADASDFIKANYCGLSLAAGATCIIDVTFKPTANKTRTAALNVEDRAVGSPQSVSLTGTGVAGSCLSRGARCSPGRSPFCCVGLECRLIHYLNFNFYACELP